MFGNLIKKINYSAIGKSSKILDLSLNNLNAFDLEGDSNIQLLFMNNNLFKKFPLETLKFPNIKSLCLNKCHISGLLDFRCPPCLLSLEAGKNKINGISHLFISSITNLTVLNLENNSIKEIPDSFPENNHLTHIILDNNKIRKIPKSLLNSKYIETFSCAHNLLVKIKPFNFTKLKVLNLSFNRIQFLPDCFEEMINLSDVNVSFNLIDKMPQSLSYCRKINSFIAATNQLR